MDRQVSEFIEQVHTELVSNLLPFWISNAIDQEGGGIHGRISNELVVDRTAPRSLVLVTRSLWTFSAAAIFFNDPEYLAVAHGIYDYFIRHFIDKKYGGAYWMLNSSGDPVDNTKKVYGHAFVIYALSEYFKATRNNKVLDQTIDFYHLTETHFGENKYGGYIEAVSRDWSPTTDWRLSMIDVNAMKSMNAHLHLLEAYTNLYSQWSDGGLRERLRELVACFRDHIIDHERHHFHLFFNEEWQLKSRSVSFGHDIEGSWLICKALEVLDDEPLRRVMLDEALA
ncbi:MAG: N-acyl-D-glucosamine 2-epimerase, partial [Dehalococcoidia bacterium]|nr:N-acyl-D-glucosamine 2-epimerase [Dehalococcoidia bacterium]